MKTNARRQAVWLLVLLALTGLASTVSADPFVAAPLKYQGGHYDVLFLDHWGETRINSQVYMEFGFKPLGDRSIHTPGWGNAYFYFKKWDPPTVQGEIEIQAMFPVAGATKTQEDGWKLKVPCTITFTSDASAFTGKCGSFDISALKRMPPNESQRWLDAHNQYRAPLNVAGLQWDDDLADKAQEYAFLLARRGTAADQCVYDHNLYNYTLDVSQYGENIAAAMMTEKTPEQVVQDWAVELPLFDAQTCKCEGGGGNCGHYTQVISQLSSKIGCGYSACRDRGYTMYIYVCNYKGPGNQKLPNGSYRAPYKGACSRASAR